jgi:YD repeat-containing protein
MVSKVEKHCEGESSGKKQSQESGGERLGREAAHASKELHKLLDEHKHVDKSESLSGMNVDQADGSQVKLNNKGQVTEVTTGHGERREYKYGTDGNPKEFKDKTGVWQSSDNKTWHCVSDPEKSDRQMEVSIDKRGNCHERHAQGETVKQTSGSTVERDLENRVTALFTPSGESQHFKYDQHGKLIEFSDSREHCTWKSANGWFWHNDKSQRWEGSFTPNPKDSSYRRFDGYNDVTTVHHADNSVDITNGRTGATVHHGANGEIKSVEVGGGAHRKYQFEYANGQLSKVHEPCGSVWQTKDGHNWTDQHGQTFKGRISVEPDGAVRYQDDKNEVTRINPDGTAYRRLSGGHAVLIDRNEVQHEVHTPKTGAMLVRTAEAIHESLKDVKSDAACELLKNASEEERKQIAQAYRNLYRTDLEKDLERGIWRPDIRDQALSYLRLKDGETPQADAAKKEAVYIHSQFASLQESGTQYGSDPIMQKRAEEQIRSTLSAMNSDQIRELNKEYRELYGKTLIQALTDNAQEIKQLSPDGYEALAIYGKGLDKRTDADVMKLAEIALRNKDLQMFQEVFAQTHDGQRKYFIDHGGEDKIRQAFGAGPLDRIGQAANHAFTELLLQAAPVGSRAQATLNGGVGLLPFQESLESLRGGNESPDTRARIALDYLHYGKRSVPSEIREGIKTLNTDDKHVDNTLSRMTLEERMLYTAGKALSENPKAAVTLSDKATSEDAKHFYKQTHGALEDAARKLWELKGISTPDSLKVAQWEEQILHPGASFLQQLNKNRDLLGNQNVDHMCREIEKMSQANWERLGQDHSYKKFVVDTVNALYPNENDRKQVLDVLEKGGRQVNFRIDNAIKPADVIAALADMPQASLDNLKKRPIDWDNLSDKVREHMQFATKEEKAVADWLMEQARQGKRPDSNLLEAFVKASAEQLDPKQALRLYEDLRRDKSSGYDQLPPAIKEAFNQTLLGKFDEQQRRELVEHGRLPIEDRVKLYCRGILGGDDKKGLVEDLLKYPPDDRKALTTNPELQKVLSHFQLEALANSLKPTDSQQRLERYAELLGVSPEKKVVEGLLSHLTEAQRKEIDKRTDALEHASDLMRAYVLGIADKEQALSLLKSLNPAQRERMENDYAIRYNHSLIGHIKELSEPDRTEFTRALTSTSAGESLHHAIDDVNASNNLVGRMAADTFSQSGPELEEARVRLQARMAEAARHYQELSPAERERIVNDIAVALERFKKDKSAAADVASSVTMAALAIAGSAPSAGFSLGALALVGGIANPVARAAVIGGDYDSKQLAADIVSGMLGGGTAGIGSAQVLKLMPFGKLIGKQAAAECAEVLKLTGPAKSVLERESIALTQNALREGGEIPAHALDDLASKLLKLPGTPAGLTHDQVVAELKKDYLNAVAAGVKEQLTNPVARVLTGKVVTNALAAGAGGEIQGTSMGVLQWNPERGIYENSSAALAQGLRAGARAAVGAGGGTALLGGIGGLSGRFPAGANASSQARAVQQIRSIREATSSNLAGAVPDAGSPVGLDHDDEKPHKPKPRPAHEVSLPAFEIQNRPKKDTRDQQT